MRTPDLARFTLLGLIWGASYTFIKVAADGLSPSLLVLGRIALGLAVLLLVAVVRRVRLPRSGVVWVHVVVAAVFGMVLPFFLLAWGERHTSAAMAGVLIGATPLLTFVLATALARTERPSAKRAVALAVGFVGVLVVISPWRSDPGLLTGQLACLGASVSYAAQTTYVRRHLSPRGLSPLALAASQLVAALVLQAGITPIAPWQPPSLSAPVVASVVVLGVVGTGLGYVLYFRLIGDIGASAAAAVNYLVPVTAVLISVVTFGNVVTWNIVVGAVIIIAAMAFAEERAALARLPWPSRPRPEADSAGSPAAGRANRAP